MPSPRSRRDLYGRPRPSLSDAREESLVERPWNAAQRKYLHAKLDEVLAEVLRRGIYADVALAFLVQDGVVQADGEVQVCYHWRYAPEEG